MIIRRCVRTLPTQHFILRRKDGVRRMDQFDCRDLVKRLDLVGRSAGNRVFGVTHNIQDPCKDPVGDIFHLEPQL